MQMQLLTFAPTAMQMLLIFVTKSGADINLTSYAIYITKYSGAKFDFPSHIFLCIPLCYLVQTRCGTEGDKREIYSMAEIDIRDHFQQFAWPTFFLDPFTASLHRLNIVVINVQGAVIGLWIRWKFPSVT